jgi:uncharacterized protein YlxW (UPF0749 family)
MPDTPEETQFPEAAQASGTPAEETPPAGSEDPGQTAIDPDQPEAADPLPDDISPEAPGTVTPREFARDFFRPSRGQLLLAAILLVVGMAMVMQFRTSAEHAPYENLRRDDLIQLLDNLNQESARLSSEVSEQEEIKRQLESGVGNEEVARKEARERLETLRILAGTAPAKGQGIELVIQDPQHKMTADILLNAIEELRDAGAEVIEINDSIRVVASTWFGQNNQGILVDGHPIRTPITIEAIGDPHALEEGAHFRGGLVSEVEGQRVGGKVTITRGEIEILSLHEPPENEYSRPA